MNTAWLIVVAVVPLVTPKYVLGQPLRKSCSVSKRSLRRGDSAAALPGQPLLPGEEELPSDSGRVQLRAVCLFLGFEVPRARRTGRVQVGYDVPPRKGGKGEAESHPS